MSSVAPIIAAAVTSIIAAANAAAKAKRNKEEETLARYSMDDTEEYEFKIVRSATGSFKSPYFLRQVIEEEKQNGWELLEKFDNSRIRLKRKKSAQSSCSNTSIDAYRSSVGTSEIMLSIYILVGFLIFMVILFFIADHYRFGHHIG